MLIKKKKKPNTQTKTKPQQTKPSNPRSRRRSSLVVVVVACPSSQIADLRSEIADRSTSAPVLGARYSMLPPALPQGISLFFSLALSQSLSLSLYLTEMKFSQIVDQSLEIADRSASALMQRCSLLPPAIRPSLKVFLSDSLLVSLSLYLTE